MRRLATIGLLGGAVVLSACGSSGSSTTSSTASGGGSSSTPAKPAKPAGEAVKLSADAGGGLFFEQRKLKAKAGTVSLVMSDPSASGTSHGIAIEGNGVDKEGPIVSPGSTSTVTVKLKPGTYEYYCPIPAHKAAGMKGTLIVS